jgi:chromate transporter
VVALVVRAIHRIGQHALTDRPLWGIAAVAAVSQLIGLHFLLPISGGGLIYFLLKGGHKKAAAGAVSLFLVGAVLFYVAGLGYHASQNPGVASGTSQAALSVPLFDLFFSGLRSGLLTFGGAYTVIPYLQHDAVFEGGWMTTAQFLDGFALSGLLPAPLIIFATFVGYLGGGPLGALVLTAGIFLPAFAFTLAGHGLVEHLIENKTFHSALDGIAAAVVGLIAATTVSLFQAGISDWKGIVIFVAGLAALYRWRSKFTAAFVILGAGALGVVFFR